MSTTDARDSTTDITSTDAGLGDADGPDRAGGRTNRGFLRDNAVSLVALAVAIGLTALIFATMPPKRNIDNAFVLLFKLTPFVAAAIAVAWLDLGWVRRLKLDRVLPALAFVGFFCYFIPRQFFTSENYPELYVITLLMVPYVILCLTLCLRLGGASTSLTLRTAIALLLLQLSGIEDLAFLLVNPLEGTPLRPIPEVWKWADHITVFIGHPPTKYEAYAFIVVHVLAALAVLFVPGAWLRDRLSRKGSTVTSE